MTPGTAGARLDRASVPPPRRRLARERPECESDPDRRALAGQRPEPHPDSHTGRVGQPLAVLLAANDADGDPITLSAAGLPGWATLIDNGDGTGTVTGRPGQGDAGTTQARITATANGVTDTEILTITIAGGMPPSIDEIPDQAVEVGRRLEVVVAATDPDGDPIVLSAESLPGWATLVDDGDGTGTVTGTPAAGDTGTTRSQVVATANGLTATATFTITVSS